MHFVPSASFVRIALRPHLLITTTFLIPLLGACVSVKPVTLTTQHAAADFKARSLDDAGLKRFAVRPGTGVSSWPPPHWDARALDVAALYFNPTLAVARAKQQAADAAIVTAAEIALPLAWRDRAVPPAALLQS